MTTRQKTIEFVTQSDATNLAVSTNRDKTMTVYIPETVVAFRSVTLVCDVATNATTAATLTAPTIGLQIAATAMSTANLGNPVANTGERQAFKFVRDVTSVFTANWSGTSQTVTCRCSFVGVATANHAFKLIITYDYDDTASTHIKTIRVPIESTRGLLTTTMQTVGGATAIPAFNGSYLPETGVTVRQVWVELWGNEACSASSVHTLQARTNGGTTQSLYLSTNTTINSSVWAYAIMDITADALTSATSLECMTLTTTSRYDNVGGMVCCTYEFDPTSTTIYNSLMLGAFDTVGWMGGTAVGNKDAWGRDIRIPEPDTITLKESAMCLSANDSGTFTWLVGAGGQTLQSHTMTAGALTCGQSSLVHRIDAGGLAGSAGITLARGANAYIGYLYSSTANAGWNAAGFLILNYTSGLSPEGVGAHNQTRVKHILNSTGITNGTNSSSSAAPAIPESDYWLTGAMINMILTTLASTNGGQSWSAQRGTGEGEETGWEALYAGQYRSDNESQNMWVFGAARKSWKRYPSDPDTDRMDLETGRVHRIDCNPAANTGALLFYTYHTQTWDVTGNITGSNGGTVDLMMFDALTDELLKQSSRSGDGAYTIPWYQDTRNVYVVAYEDSTHLGRSANGYPA